MPADVLEPAPLSGTSLTRSAGLASAATLASRLLGLVREQVLAGIFGASNDMDAYFVAFRVPNLARDLFAEGAMSAAFVPAFSRRMTLSGRTDAWQLANAVLTALLILTGALVVLGIVFAKPLVTLYAGDYSLVPGKLELAVRLTQVMLPFLMLTAVAAVLMGMLNALHQFFIPSFAPATFNIITILFAVGVVPLMPRFNEPGIIAIAVATVVGGVCQVAVQWPSLRGAGFRFRPRVNLGDPDLQRMLLLMAPSMIGLAATQVNLFVNTSLASAQGTGAVSWLTYAFRLMYLPIGLFGVSIATAVLPAASQRVAAGDVRGVADTVNRGLSLMVVLTIPAMAGLIVLAPPIVALLFERGRFTPADTAATAAAVRLYAVGLIGYSVARIISPVFYALGESRTPVVVSILTVLVNIIASVALVRLMGFRGLALGTSIAALANAAILFARLRQRLDGIGAHKLGQTAGRAATAAVVMAVVALLLEQWLSHVAAGRSIAMQSLRLGAAIGGGLIALTMTAKVLRIAEFDEALAYARGRAQKLLGT